MSNHLIPDHLFLKPDQINSMPCAAASRLLKKVLESVSVVSVCQNSDNPSIVEISVTLTGVYEFTPTCSIISVDGDGSFQLNSVKAPLVLGFHRHPRIPIFTECEVKTITLAFDFGRVINQFLYSKDIEFEIVMDGVLPQNIRGQGFSDTATTRSKFNWRKGLTPVPISIRYNENGKMIVQFEFNENVDCSCSVECVIPSGINTDILQCKDRRQEIIVDRGFSTDPYTILLKLRDSLGNVSDMNIQALVNVVPARPAVIFRDSPRRVDIGLSRTTPNGTPLVGNIAYQIWRYEGSESNARVWRDWSYRTWSAITDLDVIPRATYGYAVMYKGEYHDVSHLSSWSVVTTS